MVMGGLRVIIGTGEQPYPGWVAAQKEDLHLLNSDTWGPGTSSKASAPCSASTSGSISPRLRDVLYHAPTATLTVTVKG